MKYLKWVIVTFFLLLIFFVCLKFKIPDFTITYYKNGQKIQLYFSDLKKTNAKLLKKEIFRALNSADDKYSLLIPKKMFNEAKKIECIELKFEKSFFVFAAGLLHYDTRKIFIVLNGEHEEVLFIGNKKYYYSSIGYTRDEKIYPEFKKKYWR